jgi:hypothetical protein
VSWPHSHFYQGTPLFVARAVERGGPSQPTLSFLPALPESPKSYASFHLNRINKFRQCEGKRLVINPDELEISNNDQSQGWKHELGHDAESVFWLLVYWAIVAQPQEFKDHPMELIDAAVWTALTGNCQEREGLVLNLCNPDSRKGLTHSVYEPLGALIGKLASFLVVDRCWLPATDVRNDPEYLNEAFRGCILQFILDHRHEDFMNCAVGTTLRTVEEGPQSQALSSTRGLDSDAAEREEGEKEAKRRRLGT